MRPARDLTARLRSSVTTQVIVARLHDKPAHAFRLAAETFVVSLSLTNIRHESFRNLCIGIAQRMHRTEARMRLGLLNEEAKNIKPLNDTRYVLSPVQYPSDHVVVQMSSTLPDGCRCAPIIDTSRALS